METIGNGSESSEVIEAQENPEDESLEQIEGVDEDERPEGAEGEGQEEESPESESYSEEEFNGVDLFQVDPTRLPGAAGAVFSRCMREFRENILPELSALREFKARVEAQQRPQGDPRELFKAEVRRRAMQSLGVGELDDLNADHNMELIRQAGILNTEIAQAQAKQGAQTEAQRRNVELRQSLEAEMPEFSSIDRFAATEINRLPYAKAQMVIRDMQSGDPGRIRGVYKMFAERMKKPVEKKAAPPKLMEAQGGTPGKRTFDYESFSSGSSDEQSRMLREAGLLDD